MRELVAIARLHAAEAREEPDANLVTALQAELAGMGAQVALQPADEEEGSE